MKFKLFGRLRDDEDKKEKRAQSSNMGLNTGNNRGGGNDLDMDMGGSLDRTINNMFSQGYSEQEIKQELQGQYSPQEIEQAINNAVAVSAQGENTGQPPQQAGEQTGGPSPMSTYKGGNEALSPVDEGFENGGEQNNPMDNPDNKEMGSQQPQPNQTQQPPPPAGNQQQNPSANQEIEELIETIVAENLDQVEAEFKTVYSEIDELRGIIADLDQRIEELEIRDDEDQQEFVQKVDEMEDHFDQYQSRIGGLEKAFQQVLPSLVENVRDLTELVQEIKQERGIETSKDVSQQDIEGVDVEDW